jgi:hypothetical protein
MGVDAAALLTICSRVIAHEALYYGYDPRDPAEEVFMMQVIGLGLAVTPSAKAVAYQQLAILTRSLATNVAWRQLNQQTLVKVAQRFATQFGEHADAETLGGLGEGVGGGGGHGNLLRLPRSRSESPTGLACIWHEPRAEAQKPPFTCKNACARYWD